MKTSPQMLKVTLFAGMCAALGAGITLLAAGPLNPPSGAVSATNKTLSEVEPRIAINATNTPGNATSLFRITQPGSYYLAGNIQGVTGKHGIAIEASGVTLDLNGFELLGVAGMGAFDGVSATAGGLSNITVRNGSVRNWGDEGVDLGTVAATNCTVINVRARGNAGNGISSAIEGQVTGCSVTGNGIFGIVAGVSSAVHNCLASENGSSGVSCGGSAVVSNCVAYFNAGSGISVGSGSTVHGCSVMNNGSSGINASTGVNVQSCSTRANTLDGIVAGNQCLIVANVCNLNGNGGDGAGIHVTGSGNRIESNHVNGGDRGIDVDGTLNTIIKNTCGGATVNWNIAVGNYCHIFAPTPTAAAIAGDTGGSAPGTTNPNVNFTY
jgi:hypothetical protein